MDVFSGGTFDGVCFANAVANTALGTVVGTADAGTTYMYQVAHSSNNAAAIAPLGVQPASSSRSGQLVKAGVTCP